MTGMGICASCFEDPFGELPGKPVESSINVSATAGVPQTAASGLNQNRSTPEASVVRQGDAESAGSEPGSPVQPLTVRIATH